MKYLMVAVFLMTCKAPLPMYRGGDPNVDKIHNRIKVVKSDSVTIILNYNWYIQADTVKKDSLRK